MNLSGKSVIVTGAAHGIGEATARRMVAAGAAVLLTDVDDAAGLRVAEQLQGQGQPVGYVHHDVSDEADWHRVHASAGQLLGRIDGVCANAGVANLGAVTEFPSTVWDRLLATNLRSVYLAAHVLGTELRATRGSFVATSSVHAERGQPGFAAYAATKGAINSFIRALAVEWGRAGVRANAVLPGPIVTAMWEGADQNTIDAAAMMTALGRVGAAAEVATVVAFLVSDASSYVTGACIPVDGGWLALKDGG